MTTTSTTVRKRTGNAGHSLVELLVAMGVMSVVLGATMAGVTDAIRANDAVLQYSGMNNSLRTAMDLLVRDLLQTGSGLPTNHFISIPNGGGAASYRIPGPPGTAYTSPVGDVDINAVIPGPGRGPVINGVATDIISILTVDSSMLDVPLTAITDTTIALAAANEKGVAVDLTAIPDKAVPGQLILVEKGINTTLVQLTNVNTGTRTLTFTGGDSLNLNQGDAVGRGGTLSALRQAAPAGITNAKASRIRMITYYIDTTIPRHPRLVRRVNNGDPMTFDNSSGTAVAMDVENVQFTFDLADGSATPPTNVRFTAADVAPAPNAGGACAPVACDVNLIRKINVALTGRSANAGTANTRTYRNTLTSQVSLRGMAFVDQYQAPAPVVP